MLDDIPNGVKLAGLAFFGIAAIGVAALIRPEVEAAPVQPKPIVVVSTAAAVPAQAEAPDPWATESLDEPAQPVVAGHDASGKPIYRGQNSDQAAKEQAAANEEAGDEPPAEVEEQ